MSRLLITLTISAISLTGCGGQSPPPPYQMPGSGIAPMPLARQPAPPPPTTPADSPTSAQALSQTTTAYAESIEKDLHRGLPKSQPAAVPPAASKPLDPVFSKVQWLEPKELRLQLDPTQSPELPEKISEPVEKILQPLTNITAQPKPAPNFTDISRNTPPSLRDHPASSDELLAKLSRAVKDDPKNLSTQLDLQLLHLLLGHATPQMDTIAPLPAEDRELLATLLDGFNNFRSATKTEMNQMLAKKVRPLIEMAERLRSQADLRIANVVLCSRVDGFGAYEPISANHFIAGREYPVILYCEIENFSSHLNAAKQWETNLTQEFALYNDRGQRVWEDKRRPISDTCRNRRRDFFVRQLIRIPGHLPTGQYSLKVSITDPQSNRGTQSTATIQIVGR